MTRAAIAIIVTLVFIDEWELIMSLPLEYSNQDQRLLLPILSGFYDSFYAAFGGGMWSVDRYLMKKEI
jgi:hypothetical protein